MTFVVVFFLIKVFTSLDCRYTVVYNKHILLFTLHHFLCPSLFPPLSPPSLPLRLSYLYLGGNRLQQVPPELGQLHKLEALVLSGNQLQYLPSQFKGLMSLKSLHLHDNQLQTLPQSIVRLKNLQELSLRNNPLVLRFIREYSGAVPSLLELSGRAVKHHTISYSPEIIPETLCDFLSRARKCDNPSCSGVYFTLRSRRVTFVDFCGRYRVPLMQYLCSEQCQGSDDVFNYSSSSEDEGEDFVSAERIKRVLLG